MKLDCKAMTGVTYQCPNVSECLLHSPLDRMEAIRLYFLNQGVKPEDIKTNEISSPYNLRQLRSSRRIFTYNSDSAIRDIIIFGTPVQWENTIGGSKYFYSLSVEQLQQLIEQSFADPEKMQNNSPTIGEFMAFGREQANKGFNFTFEGYAISPFREDYRISIDGIVFDGTCPYQLIREFHEFVGEPDEIDVKFNYLRAWWD